MVVGAVVITTEEYKDLVLKANKYDLLRERTVNSTFATSDEVVIFELTEEELNDIEKRRNGK
jgi:hypothetical protein